MKKTTSSRNLKSILKKGEDHKTEFKEAVYKTINKEIVAFANTSCGKIYIGITDEGETKGINITNGLKSQIENIAKNCDPKNIRFIPRNEKRKSFNCRDRRE